MKSTLTTDVCATSEEEARRLASERHLATDVCKVELVRSSRKESVEGQSDSDEQAVKNARERLPADAEDVEEPVVIRKAQSYVVEVEAENQDEAEVVVSAQQSRTGSSLGEFSCLREPRKGICGVGKRPGRFAVTVAEKAGVTISYTVPATYRVHYTHPIIAEVPQLAGRAVSRFSEELNIGLDYSVDSLAAVDRAILEEDTVDDSLIYDLGAYFGETLRLNAGAEWKIDGEGDVCMQCAVADGSVKTLYPHGRVARRHQRRMLSREDPAIERDDSLALYFRVLQGMTR